MMTRHQVTDPRAFVLSGNAIFTVVSKKTGVRYTFKVRRKGGDEAPSFVSVLYGPDNDHDYVFLGTIFPDGAYRHGRRSTISERDPRTRAFAWFWDHVADPALLDQAEVWHEGRCGRCGRRLTVPSSIASGIGPECATKI